MAFPGVDKLLGTLLLGTYGNSMLYTLEVIAVIRYYLAAKRDNRDSRWLQALVYFTFLVDTISTLTGYACVYFYTITHWGDPDFFNLGFWPSIVVLVTIGYSETVVQFFLISRYWRMSKNVFITVVLVLIVLTGLGGSIATIYLFAYTTYIERYKLVLSDIIWFSMSAAADSAIAMALLWRLSRMKSPFRSTQSLIYRLMAWTIGTGTVTSVVAVVILILVVIDNTSNAPMTLGFCMGRVYALTMLYNLNNRGSHKGGSTNAETGDTSDSSVMKSIHLNTTVVSTIAEDHGPPDFPDHPKA